MDYKPANRNIVANLKYQACREYDKRGPRSDWTIFVGFNPNFGCYVVASMSQVNSPALVRTLGHDSLIQTKEQLIDAALDAVEAVHGKLVVYPDP